MRHMCRITTANLRTSKHRDNRTPAAADAPDVEVLPPPMQENESTATAESGRGTCATLTKMEFQLIFGNVRNRTGLACY
jgi:hypothetical protein